MRCFSTFLRHVYTMKRTKVVTICNPNKNCSSISGKTDDPPSRRCRCSSTLCKVIAKYTHVPFLEEGGLISENVMLLNQCKMY